jgi:glycerate kinase
MVMHQIVIAPDKFKGSLTGLEFCNWVERGLKKHIKNVTILKLPLADGGDGTVEVLQYYTGGKIIFVPVHDPLMRKIEASYLYASDKKLAFIEMAEASGIRLLKNAELNPLQTSTYGTGELINDALAKGAKHIILGIGGSATNDAGLGMAKALGYRFYDEDKVELEGKGQDLNKLAFIDDSFVPELVKKVKFEVACDVDNPLFGLNGAAYIYSPQKGANAKAIQLLDEGLQNFSSVVTKQYNVNLQNIPGAGAAGGLGAGCILFLDGKLKSGITLIKEIANFNKQIEGASWIITGEGKLDQQTFSGKVIKGVLDSLNKQKLAVFCGVSELDVHELTKWGIDYLAEMRPLAKDLDDSIENADKYLEKVAETFAEYLRS